MRKFLIQSVPEGYEWVTCVDPDQIERLADLAYRSGGPWVQFEMELLSTDDEGNKARRAALPWLGGEGLVLRDEAIDRIGPVLEPHGDLLPLSCATAELCLFRPHDVLDALDEQRTKAERFDDGRIMWVDEYALRPEAVEHTEVFRLASLPSDGLFFSADLVAAIRDTGDTSGTEWQVPAGL